MALVCGALALVRGAEALDAGALAEEGLAPVVEDAAELGVALGVSEPLALLEDVGVEAQELRATASSPSTTASRRRDRITVLRAPPGSPLRWPPRA
ncbi:MAG TPA: hypothetical protein VFN73_02865 [Propionibacteriaceae bacterium]|nr:hypothetical protein [Propionibacteriaceae bacterium]